MSGKVADSQHVSRVTVLWGVFMLCYPTEGTPWDESLGCKPQWVWIGL